MRSRACTFLSVDPRYRLPRCTQRSACIGGWTSALGSGIWTTVARWWRTTSSGRSDWLTAVTQHYFSKLLFSAMLNWNGIMALIVTMFVWDVWIMFRGSVWFWRAFQSGDLLRGYRSVHPWRSVALPAALLQLRLLLRGAWSLETAEACGVPGDPAEEVSG